MLRLTLFQNCLTLQLLMLHSVHQLVTNVTCYSFFQKTVSWDIKVWACESKTMCRNMKNCSTKAIMTHPFLCHYEQPVLSVFTIFWILIQAAFRLEICCQSLFLFKSRLTPGFKFKTASTGYLSFRILNFFFFFPFFKCKKVKTCNQGAHAGSSLDHGCHTHMMTTCGFQNN